MTTSDPRHVISTQQFFDRDILAELFASAQTMKRQVLAGKVEPALAGKLLAALFYEPSTRTRFSFEAAMQRLGGGVISTEAASHFSSVTKGESLEDTITVTAGYADVIVLRHPEIGSAERAAAVSSVPIINAGDGGGEHPTQALLDIFTIQDECGRVDKLKIALVGDLLYGRTVHSLLFLLALHQNVEITLIAPKQLRLPKPFKAHLTANHIRFNEQDSLDSVDHNLDVLYVTRVQKERFHSADEYERLKNYFIINNEVANRLKPEAIIMHPLPRVGEIDTAVDADPRAAYFRQAQNGLYVRMALLAHILG